MSVSALLPEVAIFLLAVLWDLLFGEPKRLHPVRGIGKLIVLLEQLAPKKGTETSLFLYGLGMTAGMLTCSIFSVMLVMSILHSLNTVAYIAGGAYLLKGSFAVRELNQAARRVYDSLEKHHISEARRHLRSLVSRDPTHLTPELMVAATVESIAENTTDSFVAPWLAFALFGLPGAMAYRVLNTLDSMIGYTHQHYGYLGKAAARLDDLVNLVPARLATLCIILGAYWGGFDVQRAWYTMWRDHKKTASPNAGWTMSAMAGALGVELEKIDHYRLGTALRPLTSSDILHALKIMQVVTVITFILTFGILSLRLSGLRL